MKNTTGKIQENGRITTLDAHVKTNQAMAPGFPHHATDNLRSLSEKSKLVRRYSFDDNGGGYTGL